MKRSINSSLIESLKSTDLWQEKLRDDCMKQEVFLALRNNRIDFYHKGGKLFQFDKNGFSTHIKYAAVIQNIGKDYLTENELKQCRIAPDFLEDYARIKENCSIYAKSEAGGVSDVYHKHSYLSESNVVVLDIEVSFKSFDEEKRQDRIDILLLHKDKGALQFVEAKHFSNSEIWSTKMPAVINQINRYEQQVSECKDEILKEYTFYVTTVNFLFGMDLSVPIDIDPKVTLMIFDFDRDQLQGRMYKLIKQNHEYSGIKVYTIGNIAKIVPRNLWNVKDL